MLRSRTSYDNAREEEKETENDGSDDDGRWLGWMSASCRECKRQVVILEGVGEAAARVASGFTEQDVV